MRLLTTHQDWIKQARELAKQRDVSNVEFHVASILNLEFEADRFDVVHAHQVLLHVGDPLTALREMRRVAKLLVSSRDNTRRILVPALPALVHQIQGFDDLLRSRGANPEFGEVNHIRAYEAGFEWDKMEMSSWRWEYSGRHGRDM